MQAAYIQCAQETHIYTHVTAIDTDYASRNEAMCVIQFRGDDLPLPRYVEIYQRHGVNKL